MPKTATKPKHPAKPGKIKKLSELEAILRAARKAGRRVALCHGVFDLVHPGHIVHFREARKHGDLLVVTLTPDRFVNKGPGRPLFNQQLRLETLAAIEAVDYVALNEWPTAVETIRLLKPHVYVKGSDYADAGKDVTGKISDEERAVQKAGGRLVFTDGFTSSSSHLINRFFSVYPSETQEYLQGLRSLYSADQVLGHLKSLADLKVLVVGEAIIDQYSYCIPLGKSPKETIVSSRFSTEELFAGGAVATANHMAGFCKEVTLVTPLGRNQGEKDFISSKLRPNVRLAALELGDRPTVRKQRFIEPDGLRKMFELQYLDDAPIGPEDEKRFGRIFDAELAGHDLLVVNDFGHGFLTPQLRETVSACGKYLALNTQSNSANHGFNPVTNYRRADYVAIDEPELRLAARNKYGSIPDLAAKVRQHLRVDDFLISRGSLGSVVLSDDGWHEAPALATRIVDRVGAGDALFAVTSPCVFKGVPRDLVCFIGNCVGALAVGIVGNREPVDPISLSRFIQTLLK